VTAAHVLERLRAADPEHRRLALRDLGALGAADAGAALLVALGDTDWRVRKEAASAARALEDRPTVATILVAALDDKTNVGLRNAAVEALGALGSDAIPAATRALETLDADGRKLAVEVLGGVPDARATSALVSALGDGDANVRATAAEQLGRAAAAGDDARAEAVRGLVGVLGANEPMLVLSALGALDELHAEPPWATLATLTRDPLTRSLALRLAARSPDLAADAALADAIAVDGRAVAREAVIGLADRVIADPSRVAELRRVLCRDGRAGATVRGFFADDDLGARAGAAVLLGVLAQPEDLPLLMDALSDPDLEDRAELALSLYGDAAVSALLVYAGASPPARRASVLPIVGALSRDDAPQVLDTMRVALADAAPEVVASAARVLGSKGTEEDLARLAPLAAHTDARVAAAAGAALVSLGARHQEAARSLLHTFDPNGPLAAAGCVLVEATRGDAAWATRALTAGDARTRRAAVEALAAVGSDDAREAVAIALADEDRDVQLAAVRALGRLGAVEAIATLLASPRDGEVVGASLRALGEVDPDRTEALARPLVGHDDPAVACAAVDAIGRWGGTRREDGLFEALGHRDQGVVTLAISELAQTPSTRAVARLGTCLDHPSWEVRRLAAEVLGQTGNAAARELIRTRLDREDDPSVREALQWSLSSRPDREDET
jgi:HEAT repeat protein